MYNRHVYLGEWSEVGVDHRCTYLTPNENAARRLGVEPLSLETLAQQILGNDRTAHPVKVQHLLRRAVEELLGSTDPDGLARILLSPIRELFPGGAGNTPEPGPQGVGPMDTTSVAYVLCRIEDDSSLTPVSEHEDISAGVTAGKHRVEVEDFDFGYALFADGVKVASFAEGRIGYREWVRRNGRLADIHSIHDRFDHDIDELMA